MRGTWFPSGKTIALAGIAAAALVTAAGAWAVGAAGASGAAKGNVTFKKSEWEISNGGVGQMFAKCPANTKVFMGGYASDGLNLRVTVAGPARTGVNGYIVHGYVPPVNLSAGVVKETVKVTIVAWCAPAGQPIVLP